MAREAVAISCARPGLPARACRRTSVATSLAVTVANDAAAFPTCSRSMAVDAMGANGG